MLYLILGGAASGKSAYAEELACRLHKENASGREARLWYVATMRADTGDPETLQRIRKHRLARARKGFETLEITSAAELGPGPGAALGMAPGALQPGDTALLEDLPNLLAEEMFGNGTETAAEEGAAEAEAKARDAAQDAAQSAARRIAGKLLELSSQGVRIAAVSGRIAEDGADHDPWTKAYVLALQELHRILAAEAAEVTEVICGIPVHRKKTEKQI